MKTLETIAPKRTIVVCGATGTQGGSVIRQLLETENLWHIVALTRDDKSSKAQTLKELGVEVKKANFETKEPLINAFKGADAVFGVTQPWSEDNKHCYPEKEIQQGRNIVDACVANKVPHLLFSSVLNFTEKKFKMLHVESKFIIEDYLISSGQPYTLLRLPQFMDNLGSHFFPVKKGLIKGFIDADAKVPYISSGDIGKLALHIFLQPEKYLNKEVSVIGDMVSGIELGRMMESIREGEKFRYKSVPRFLIRLFAKEFYPMRQFYETYGRPPFLQVPERVFHETRENPFRLTSMKEFLIEKGFHTRALG
ncbi:NmrA/HSCARG family protein [Pleomorphovibrio marinus]|uniref:NmrA/HSCARG family protein n=1 Tax=Pleomorphovibrio marinus TaxID=2164132 RepID=UPI000E0B47AE|nr:NmrA/HSCARG family protein [Pleomorphovibrio marinus]